MLLNFLDDVFLLHFAFKPTQCVFQRLTFLNADFSHLDFTILPMHVAMIAIYHYNSERHTPIIGSLGLTSSGPTHRSQALFLDAWGLDLRRPAVPVWDFWPLLVEWRGGDYPLIL